MQFARRGIMALSAAALAFWSAPASAHPLGNFTINHLLKVRQTGDRLELRYVLDMAEIPTFSVMRARSATASLDTAGLHAWASDEIPIVLAGIDCQSRLLCTISALR